METGVYTVRLQPVPGPKPVRGRCHGLVARTDQNGHIVSGILLLMKGRGWVQACDNGEIVDLDRGKVADAIVEASKKSREQDALDLALAIDAIGRVVPEEIMEKAAGSGGLDGFRFPPRPENPQPANDIQAPSIKLPSPRPRAR